MLCRCWGWVRETGAFVQYDDVESSRMLKSFMFCSPAPSLSVCWDRGREPGCVQSVTSERNNLVFDTAFIPPSLLCCSFVSFCVNPAMSDDEMSSGNSSDEFSFSCGSSDTDGLDGYEGNTMDVDADVEIAPGLIRRQSSYKIHDEDMVGSLVDRKIQEIEGTFAVSKSIAVSLLLSVDWDSGYLQRQWWADGDEHAQQVARDAICAKAGLPRAGPIYFGEYPRADEKPCGLCGAVPQALFQTLKAAQKSVSMDLDLAAKKKKKTKNPGGVNKGAKAIQRQLKRLLKAGYNAYLPGNETYIVRVDLDCQGMWTGIVSTFEITVDPTEYPLKAPLLVTCVDVKTMFHPNIDPTTGEVCLGSLITDWSPMNSMDDIVHTLQTGFLCPNWAGVNQACTAMYNADEDHATFLHHLKGLGACGASSSDQMALGTTMTKAPTAADPLSGDVDLDALETTRATHALACGHYFCVACWTTYIEGKDHLRDMSCPHKDGKTGKRCVKLIDEDLIRSVGSPKHLEMYQKDYRDAFVFAEQTTKFCPGNCGRIINYPSLRSRIRDIRCACGAYFCWECHEEPHNPISCANRKAWIVTERELFKGLSTAELWAAQNIKPCPKCKKNIYKDGGCMHMTCRDDGKQKGCRYEFCWLCLEEWSQHRSNGVFACTKFHAGRSELNETVQAALAASHLEKERRKQLEFYEFHVQRFQFQEDSSNHALESRKNFLEWKGSLPPGSKADERANILVNACESVAKCRHLLRWIYVMKYYMPEEASSKALFECQHHQFEGIVNALHEILNTHFQDFASLGAVDGVMKQLIDKVILYTVNIEQFYQEISDPEEFNAKYLRSGNGDESLVGMSFFLEDVVSPVAIAEARKSFE